MAIARKTPSEIRVNQAVFPNGEIYFRVMLGNESVGAFTERDGGYVLFGCRKPIASMEATAREAVWRRLQRLLGEAAVLATAVDLPVSVAAVREDVDQPVVSPRA